MGLRFIVPQGAQPTFGGVPLDRFVDDFIHLKNQELAKDRSPAAGMILAELMRSASLQKGSRPRERCVYQDSRRGMNPRQPSSMGF
jgi:hypothetical protein